MTYTIPAVDLERLASTLRCQEQRFLGIISDLERSEIPDSSTRDALRKLEGDLRRLPAYAA